MVLVGLLFLVVKINNGSNRKDDAIDPFWDAPRIALLRDIGPRGTEGLDGLIVTRAKKLQSEHETVDVSSDRVTTLDGEDVAT
ncbi:unnamed protein product [Heligmosomoides polygyrus]|uniref:Transmembrane protein n=1 Tax=Heligmosomoides polygyrus TaxID=6339 RepID=A0A183FAA4_HELPZ|nr:unnamed protein product [Heligmosomoides polygyrus]